MVWVRFSQVQKVDGRIYQPGDWLDVEAGLAKQWILSGVATVGRLDRAMPIGDECGVAIDGDLERADRLKEYYPRLKVTAQEGLALPFEKNLLWQPSFRLRPEMMALGFELLERWLVAAPMIERPGEEMVTYYDPRLLFVRRHEETLGVLAEAARKMEEGKDLTEALAEAIYESRLIALALPEAWLGG